MNGLWETGSVEQDAGLGWGQATSSWRCRTSFMEVRPSDWWTSQKWASNDERPRMEGKREWRWKVKSQSTRTGIRDLMFWDWSDKNRLLFETVKGVTKEDVTYLASMHQKDGVGRFGRFGFAKTGNPLQLVGVFELQPRCESSGHVGYLKNKEEPIRY